MSHSPVLKFIPDLLDYVTDSIKNSHNKLDFNLSEDLKTDLYIIDMCYMHIDQTNNMVLLDAGFVNSFLEHLNQSKIPKFEDIVINFVFEANSQITSNINLQ